MLLIRKKLWAPLLIFASLGFFLFFDSRWLPSPDEARELAAGVFERYAEQERIDIGLFEGPVEAGDVSGVAYAFRWTYTGEEGKLTVLVLVDRGGWTDLSLYSGDSYDGSQAAIDEIEHLEQRIRERSRPTG